MNVLVDCPESRRGEWAFRAFGIPVRVKPWFWIAVLLLSGEEEPLPLFIWVSVCFCSILLHEFGHVWAFRLFGTDGEAVLYAWGGLAIPDREVRGSLGRLVVALAGPTIGFVLAAAAAAAATTSGGALHFGFHNFLPSISAWPPSPDHDLSAWYILLNDLLYVNFYWGILNLLPVYPLDGGHAARAILEQRDPAGGRRTSLIVSAVVASVLALLAISTGSYYRVLMFALLAVSSMQALESARGASRLYRSPR